MQGNMSMDIGNSNGFKTIHIESENKSEKEVLETISNWDEFYGKIYGIMRKTVDSNVRQTNLDLLVELLLPIVLIGYLRTLSFTKESGLLLIICFLQGYYIADGILKYRLNRLKSTNKKKLKLHYKLGTMHNTKRLDEVCFQADIEVDGIRFLNEPVATMPNIELKDGDLAYIIVAEDASLHCALSNEMMEMLS